MAATTRCRAITPEPQNQTVVINNAGGTANFTAQACGGVSISPTSLPGGQVNTFYSQNLYASKLQLKFHVVDCLRLLARGVGPRLGQRDYFRQSDQFRDIQFYGSCCGRQQQCHQSSFVHLHRPGRHTVHSADGPGKAKQHAISIHLQHRRGHELHHSVFDLDTSGVGQISFRSAVPAHPKPLLILMRPAAAPGITA